MLRGFLDKKRVAHVSRRRVQPRVPLMFKVDYTIDENFNLRIFELGHPFSSNLGGLEGNMAQLIQKLRLIYDHIYLSGDYYECSIIQSNLRGKIPSYIPIHELTTVRTPNSIVIIRCYESPTQFTPFLVQKKLRDSGSDLAVFNADPVGCLVAYEKILMQRFQAMMNDEHIVPTALVNVSKNIHEQFFEQKFTLTEDYYLVKPAFSSCGWGIRCMSKEELEGYFHMLRSDYQRRDSSSKAYQRGPADFLKLIFAGPTTNIDLKDRKAYFLQRAHQHGMNFLFSDEVEKNRIDPFVLVQPIIRPYPIPTADKKGQWLFTNRVFILIEKKEDADDVKISLLGNPISLFPKQPYSPGTPITGDVILAGLETNKASPPTRLPDDTAEDLKARLNQSNIKRFFNAILNARPDSFLENLTSPYPELTAYCGAIKAYPPYHVLLDLPAHEIALKHYQNFSIILKLELNIIRARREPGRALVTSVISNYLRQAITAFQTYRLIREQDMHKNFSYPSFFLNKILRPALKTRRHCVEPSQAMLHDYLTLALAVLTVNIDIIENIRQSLTEINPEEDIKKCINFFFELYPVARDLAKKSLTNPQDAQLRELMINKHCRDTVMDFSIQLKQLETAMQKRSWSFISSSDAILNQKDVFIQWTILYLQSISIPAELFSSAGKKTSISEGQCDTVDLSLKHTDSAMHLNYNTGPMSGSKR